MALNQQVFVMYFMLFSECFMRKIYKEPWKPDDGSDYLKLAASGIAKITLRSINYGFTHDANLLQSPESYYSNKPILKGSTSPFQAPYLTLNQKLSNPEASGPAAYQKPAEGISSWQQQNYHQPVQNSNVGYAIPSNTTRDHPGQKFRQLNHQVPVGSLTTPSGVPVNYHVPYYHNPSLTEQKPIHHPQNVVAALDDRRGLPSFQSPPSSQDHQSAPVLGQRPQWYNPHHYQAQEVEPYVSPPTYPSGQPNQRSPSFPEISQSVPIYHPFNPSPLGQGVHVPPTHISPSHSLTLQTPPTRHQESSPHLSNPPNPELLFQRAPPQDTPRIRWSQPLYPPIDKIPKLSTGNSELWRPS